MTTSRRKHSRGARASHARQLISPPFDKRLDTPKGMVIAGLTPHKGNLLKRLAVPKVWFVAVNAQDMKRVGYETPHL